MSQGLTSVVDASELVDDFAPFGIRAFTTTRASGSFGLGGSEPVATVMARWARLRADLRSGANRLATAGQVHGDRVVVHTDGWEGWLRADSADGHVATTRGTAVAVTIADCVPVFLAHPSGVVAALHSGWRGTAARIVERAIALLAQRRIPARELRMHLGPAICGRCYEVSADVARQLGVGAADKVNVDLRAIIASHARAAGVTHVTTTGRCTRCDNDRFFSHRAGDPGRQLAVIVADR